ncbi:MAG: hypothetical protein J0L51_00040 [Rhizobiales bacterium]|nr:hypothetical protein [Hyphomicrobiales bacterium]
MSEQAIADTTTETTAAAEQAAAAASASATTSAAEGSKETTAEKPWYGSLDGLNDDQKAFLGGKKPADFAAALNSWMNADRLARDRNAMIRPEPGREKDWSGWTDLGWPAELKEYQLKAPSMPEGLEFDNQAMSEFASMLHEQRVPLAQGQAIIERLGATMAKFSAAEAEATARLRTEELDALKTEWGADFDKRTTLAGRAARALGLDKDKMDQIEAALGSNRIVLELFDKLAPFFSEDQIIAAAGAGNGFSGPDAVEIEISRFKRDPELARSVMDPSHKDHKANKARWEKLNEQQAAYRDARRA